MNKTDLKNLIQKQKSNFTLDQEFYVNEDIFDLDIKNIFSKQWVFVGHVSRIPNYGDYFLFNIGKESIIIIRDKDDLVHAHYNVCRHRGSHICLENEGNIGCFRPNRAKERSSGQKPATSILKRTIYADGPRPLKVSSAMPDLSSSPSPTSTILSY